MLHVMWCAKVHRAFRPISGTFLRLISSLSRPNASLFTESPILPSSGSDCALAANTPLRRSHQQAKMDKKGKSEHPEELPPEPQQAAQPDRRGRIAWLQVLVGFLATVNSFGFISAFGVFQIHYPPSLYASPSQVSWIGSTPLFLLTALCVLGGRLVDAGYFYATVITGAVLQVIGIYCASVAKSYGAVLFTQGIFMGVGCGSMYAP
jgi:hypothetical protein